MGSIGQIRCHSGAAQLVGGVDSRSSKSEDVFGGSVGGCNTGLIGICSIIKFWDESIEGVAGGSSSGS